LEEKMKKIKQFWDKFTDDQEYISFKLTIIAILMIAGMVLDRR